MTVDIRETLATCTLERYETEFADRHLLHGVIAKWARERPEHLAIIEHDTGKELTYRELDELSTAQALKLLDMGYQRGDFLATLLPLLLEHVVLEYACFKIGVVHVPLDLRLKAPEVVRSLGLVYAKGLVFSGDFREIVSVVQRDCAFIEHYVQIAGEHELVAGAVAYHDFAAAADQLAAEDPSPLRKIYREIAEVIVPTDGAQVIYTTGSTGFPKPALLSHRNVTAQNLCLATGFDLFNSPSMLVNLPPSHVGCQAEQLMTTLFTGHTAVILHVFDAERSLEAIQQHQVDCFGQIPAMFNMQFRLPNFADYDLSSIQRVLFGGQQVPAQFVRQLASHYPMIGTGLGLSEMAGFVTYTGMTDQVKKLVDTVGWWAPITPVSIRRPMHENGNAGGELPDGEIGEICFSGPQVFIDYVNNPEAYAKTVSQEGICYTGDLGYVSDRGLIFSGRSKLVIKPKGYQVHPAQIESHFCELREQVAACGAVGVPHEVFTEGVVLFVERKPDATLTVEELEAHAHGIAAYMRPLHYVLLEPGQFPLNRISKTDYVKLGELAMEQIHELRSQGAWDT